VVKRFAGQGVAALFVLLRSADVGVTGQLVAKLHLKGHSSSYWCDPRAKRETTRSSFIPANFTSECRTHKCVGTRNPVHRTE